MTADPALDTLPEWPWPRWAFHSAVHDDDGITVALVPAAHVARNLDACSACRLRLGVDPDTLASVYDSGWIHATDGRTLDSTGAENTFDG